MVYPSTSTSTAPGFIAVPGTVLLEQPPKDLQQPLEDYAMEILRKENTFKINSGIRMTEAILKLADGALKPTLPQNLPSFQYQEAAERTNTLDKDTKVIHRRLKEIANERKSMEEIVKKLRNVSTRSEATLLAWKIANSDMPDPEDILLLDKITRLLRLEDEQEQLLGELRRKNKAMENVLDSADDILLACPWFRNSLDSVPKRRKKKNVNFHHITEVKPFNASDEANKVRFRTTYTMPTFKDEETRSSLEIYCELSSMKKEEESIPVAYNRLVKEASLTLISVDSSEELHDESSENITSNFSVSDSDESMANEINQTSSVTETGNVILTSINEASNANGKNSEYKEKQVSNVEIPDKQNQRNQTNGMPQVSIENLKTIVNNVDNEIQTNKTSETSNASCESETCKNANIDNKTGKPNKKDNLEITKIDNNPDEVNEVTNFCLGGKENLLTSVSETSNMNITNIQNREDNEKGNLDVKRIENESSYSGLVHDEGQATENVKNLKEAAGTVNQSYMGEESNQVIIANEHSSNQKSTSLPEIITNENHSSHISITDDVIISTNAVQPSNEIKTSVVIMSTNENQQSNLNENNSVKTTPNEHQSSYESQPSNINRTTNENQPYDTKKSHDVNITTTNHGVQLSDVDEANSLAHARSESQAEKNNVEITNNENHASHINITDDVIIPTNAVQPSNEIKTSDVIMSTNENQLSNLNEESSVKTTPNEHQSSNESKTDHVIISTIKSQPSNINRTTNENQPCVTSKSHDVIISTINHEAQLNDVDEADSLVHARSESQADRNNVEITNNVDYTSQENEFKNAVFIINENPASETSVEGYKSRNSNESNESHNGFESNESHNSNVCDESSIVHVFSESQLTMVSNEVEPSNEDQDSTTK